MNRIYQSAIMGARHNRTCVDEMNAIFLREDGKLPEGGFDIANHEDKPKAIDFISSELFICYGNDPVPDMTDAEVDAAVTAEAEEIYQAWRNL